MMFAMDIQRGGQSATLEIPVANGRLVAHATTIRSRSEDLYEDQIAIRLRLEASRVVTVIERLILLALTPFQREIALFALLGGERRECEAEFGVSDSALKIHTRAIYKATGVSDWGDLAAKLRQGQVAGSGRP